MATRELSSHRCTAQMG